MKRNGFALVELLVVIAIMVLLAGLLFPVLGAAREKTRQVACASNLRNLTQAGMMYAQDYNEHYFSYSVIKANYLWNVAFEPYLKNRQVHLCPDAMRTLPNHWGDVHHAWSDYYYTGSYGYNGFLYCDAGPGSVCTLGAVSAPASTVWIADAVWIDAWPLPSNPPCIPLNKTPIEGLWRFCMGRHNGGINVGFADTHVKFKRQEALNTLRFLPQATP